MTDERKNELGNTFILKDAAPQALAALEIEELCFLIRTAEYLIETSAFAGGNLAEKPPLFRAALIALLKASDALFIAYDAATEYPYIDPEARMWLFSRQEFALGAQAFYAQSIPLEIRKIYRDEIEGAFAELHIMGIEKVLLDNGHQFVEFHRDELLPPPDWSGTPKASIPVSNPQLMFAMIRFFQTLHAKTGGEDRAQRLGQLEDAMLDAITSARFLVPMRVVKAQPSADPQGTLSLEKGDKLEFARISDESGKQFQPAFTDWIEFGKAFDQNVWGGNVASCDDLFALAQSMNGVVINPNGLPLLINDTTRQKINQRRGLA